MSEEARMRHTIRYWVDCADELDRKHADRCAEIDRLNAEAWGAAVVIQAMREDAARVTRNAMTGMDALETQVERLSETAWDATSGD